MAFAGDVGYEPIELGSRVRGREYHTTCPDDGLLHKVVYCGLTGDHFDQYPYEEFVWVDGPRRGECEHRYGRTFYQKV